MPRRFVALALFDLFALLVLGTRPSPAVAKDGFFFQRSPLWGGFVFRVDADAHRTVAYTTGGTFLRTAGSPSWSRFAGPGPDVTSHPRFLAGAWWAWKDGAWLVRNDTTREWEHGPDLGGYVYDATVLPGEEPEILWATLHASDSDPYGETSVLLTRGDGPPREIGSVPRNSGGESLYRRLAVSPDGPERVRLVVPLIDPTITWVFGRDGAEGAWNRWSLPFFLTEISAVPGTDRWVGIASPWGSAPGDPMGLVLSDDGGRTWREAGTDARLRRIRTVTVRPDTGALLLGAFDGAVLETPDLGKTLAVRREGGGADQVTSIAVVPGRPDRFRIGTQAGFYRSDDGGRTWEWDVEGLTAIQCTGLFAGADGRVIVFDYHQGPRISVDGGRTFARYSPLFKERWGTVYAARTGGETIVLDVGKDRDAPATLVSRDEGRTWARVAGDESRGRLLGILRDGTIAAASREQGILHLTEDLAWAPMPDVDAELPEAPRELFSGPGDDLVVQTGTGLRVLGSKPRWMPAPPPGHLATVFPDPMLPNVFYGSAGPGDLWRGDVETGSWSRLLVGDDAWTWGLAADPGRPGRRIACFSDGGIATSENEGVSWRALVPGRFETVTWIAVGPDRRLRALADGGLWSLPLSGLDGD